MSSLSTRLLSELDPLQPLYAVLDGARDPRIRGWVLDTRAPRVAGTAAAAERFHALDSLRAA